MVAQGHVEGHVGQVLLDRCEEDLAVPEVVVPGLHPDVVGGRVPGEHDVVDVVRVPLPIRQIINLSSVLSRWSRTKLDPGKLPAI